MYMESFELSMALEQDPMNNVAHKSMNQTIYLFDVVNNKWFQCIHGNHPG